MRCNSLYHPAFWVPVEGLLVLHNNNSKTGAPQPVIEARGSVEEWLHSFLISVVTQGLWLVLRPGHISSEKEPCARGWVGPRAGRDALGER